MTRLTGWGVIPLVSLFEFSISRLHCFRRLASLRFAPLTLLFGHNNAGKSTLLRSIALLASSVGGPVAASLDLSCEAARGASYHDLRSRYDSVNEMTFELAWKGRDEQREAATIRLMEEPGGGHVVKAMSLVAGDVVAEVRVSLDVQGAYELVRKREVVWSGALPFEGVRPVADAAQPAELRALIERVGARMDGLRATTEWLTAVRAHAPRKRAVPHQEPPRRSDGAWAQVRLAQDAVRGRSELIHAVSKTLEDLFDCTLHVDIDEDEALLRASPRGVAWRVPLADLGEGFVQVLPVITLCSMAELGELGEEPTLCIEQPEMHLHPDAERSLARFLVRVASSPSRPRLVLESHSEILLSAFLLEVARGLPPSTLSLHWVGRESAASESWVQHVEVDAKGQPEPWPIGAFRERPELARELFLARRRGDG